MSPSEMSTPGTASGEWWACARTYTLATAVLEGVRHEVLESGGSRLQHGEETFQLFPYLIGARQRLFERDGQREHLAAAFTAAEQGTARLFLEELGRSRTRGVGRISAGLLRQEEELDRRREDLERHLRREQSKPDDQQEREKRRQQT